MLNTKKCIMQDKFHSKTDLFIVAGSTLSLYGVILTKISALIEIKTGITGMSGDLDNLCE